MSRFRSTSDADSIVIDKAQFDPSLDMGDASKHQRI